MTRCLNAKGWYPGSKPHSRENIQLKDEPQSTQPVPEIADTKSLEEIEEKLKKLEKMKADGLITNAEYLNLKKKIIDKY